MNYRTEQKQNIETLEMEESEDMNDTYVSQLKEVFDSCDTTGSGCLNEDELQILCEKLHLTDHANILAQHLLENELEVKFEDFKECFVAILTQAIPSEGTTDSTSDDVADREVSPKFTLGRKKYGRRSRPASIADDDDSSSASAVLTPQSSTDLSSMDRIPKSSSPVENVPGKRPMSPSNAQQPPTKSGRMTGAVGIGSSDTPEISSASRRSSDSEADLSQSFENNPVQYLQETWKKLGIGQSGYLNVEELAMVCEHIGMDMTEEVVAQLFEKLDCDQDGQISFDEFLQGLFQHGEPQNCDSPLLKSDPPKSVYNEGSRDDHQISNTSISGIFSSIDPNNTGYAEPSAILELWESLELACSPQLLEELGFSTHLKVNLSDLTSVLEELLLNVLKRPILQLAFMSFQNELQFLRQSIDQILSERNKLRVNVEEANTRAALLAQEVDDNHAKLENSLQKKLILMEKKYQEQARELLEELQQERDNVSSQTTKLNQQLQKDISTFKEEETKLKSRLSLLEQENNRLDQEMHEVSEKYLESEKQNEILQKELAVIPDLKQRLAGMESQLSELQEHQHQSLLQEIETYKKTNQELKDKIDELTLEMESMHQNTMTESPTGDGIRRTHSWLSDYKKASIAGYKRRGSGSSSDENSDEESPTIGKLRRTFFSDGKLTPELDVEDSNRKKPHLKGNQPSPVEVLVTDMMLDHSCLMKKLQVSEEKRLKLERAYKRSENKNKILHRILYNMALA